MAEMTKDMYGAVGRVGNKTYYQRLGKTIVRTNTRPKNPKTFEQSQHRVLVKAVNKSYSQLKDICNHTFEDCDNAFECMNKFKKVNLKYLSEHAMSLMKSGQTLGHFYQFTPINSEKWTPFAAIISEGHLPVVTVGIDAEEGHKAYVATPGCTYADFVTTCFPCPNRKNELNFSAFVFAGDRFNFVLGRGGDVAAAGIIVSREGAMGNWLRSNCQLLLDETAFGSDICSLAEAVAYSYKTPDIDMESELYLNNAGGGGK